MPQLGRRRLLQHCVPMAAPYPSRGQNGELVPSAALPSVSSKRYSRRFGACSSLSVPGPLIDTCLPSPASSLVWAPAPGVLLAHFPMPRALAAAARQLGHLQARSHACPSTPSSQVRANHGRCSRLRARCSHVRTTLPCCTQVLVAAVRLWPLDPLLGPLVACSPVT